MLILGMLTVLVAVDVVLTALVVNRLYGKTPAQKLDAIVEQAMEEDREAMRRSRAMDEGFDNLMRYEVRGMDGFGGV